MSVNTVPRKQPIKVVLCWHMHQPQYRNLLSDTYALPWTYLHATKDYVDMAAILESLPEACAVVNFSPVMLEQIEQYSQRIQAYLTGGGELNDPLLAALAGPLDAVTPKQFMTLVDTCLRVNKERLINRFPPYRRLAELAATFSRDPESLIYFNTQYLADILVWYHLAWMGETVRRQDPRIIALDAKGQRYTLEDRRQLLEIIGELLGGVIQRYRVLAERGQVELSMTPYAHPILPLLLDMASAREAMPAVDLPTITTYPGGLDRARWHIRKGKAVFQRHFGFEPQGCWPAEGGVSTAALQLLGERGFTWAATGEKVLSNSLHAGGQINGQTHAQWLCQPYQVRDSGISCFFRDDGLSDLIGFTYSNWHSDDAVNNLAHHLENIAVACQNRPTAVVSIIMDGENAWEHYPDNAYHFLTALYERLTADPKLELTTFSAYLSKTAKHPRATLKTMVAGSWVYGTFSTWIGDPAKNRGWDMLCEAKRTFDAVVHKGTLKGNDLVAAEEQLAICEGSDWFWWFGDYNPAATVSDFEKLFRLHLSNLYTLLGAPAPDYLGEIISYGSTDAVANSGTMRPST